MFFSKRVTLVSAAAVAAAFATLVTQPGSATQAAAAPQLAYDATALQPDSIPSAAPVAAPVQDADVSSDDTAQIDQAELECMAKVVMHESRGQPRQGQVAVAQILVNRMKAGRFGGSICAVANQPGQFFHIASYRPNHDSSDWQTAMDVSREVLSGDADAVAPGALFFRANYAPADNFFRTRQRVAAVGAHIFYR